jgi:hypothetical protein
MNGRMVKEVLYLSTHACIKDRITVLGGVPDNFEGSAAGGTQEGQF